MTGFLWLLAGPSPAGVRSATGLARARRSKTSGARAASVSGEVSPFPRGWQVKRFWVQEVRDDLPRCVRELVALMAGGGVDKS